MDKYKIVVKPSVEKDLRKVPARIVPKILSQIKGLAVDPLSRHARKLTGAERLWRLRMGNYRIIYEVDQSKKVITIHYVRHRQDAYKS